METAPPSSAQDPRGTGAAFLSRLGTGDSQDRLSFRHVLALLTRCLRLLRPVRRHILLLFLGFSSLALLLLPVGLLVFDVFFTRVLDGQPLLELEATLLGLDPARFVETGALMADERRDALWRIGVLALGVTVFVTPAFMALYYYQTWILQRVNQVLRLELMDRFQSLSLRFHADNQVGDAIYRIVQDSAMVTQLIDVLFMTPIATIARYLFSVGAVALFDPGLALFLALIVPLYLGVGAYFSRRLRMRFRTAREKNSVLTSRIQETLVGIKVLKAYGAELREQARFEEASHEAFSAAYRARGMLAGYLVGLFWIAGFFLVVSGAVAALHTNEASDVTLAAFGFTVWNLGLFNYFKARFGDGTGQLRHLMRTWGRTQDIAIGLDRVFEVIDLEPEVRDAPDAVPFPGLHDRLRYRDVAFRYQPDRPGLEGVDFEARVGTVNAIVGPTGSGKTTLTALLLRLFEPDRGSIEIDGVPIRQIQLESLRKSVAVALQENMLFGTTIRENIRYAVPDATDAQVRAAAHVACADAFIEQQEQGYDTLLGERGTKLSSGQRQRLSIARAVLKDPPILILDEPTASLDAETELLVLQRLAEWGKGRLIFLITHRLSTIRRADRILVLRDGRIAESGTHDELIASDGTYRRLVASEEAPETRHAAAGMA